jgi:hypothetical protein
VQSFEIRDEDFDAARDRVEVTRLCEEGEEVVEAAEGLYEWRRECIRLQRGQ